MDLQLRGRRAVVGGASSGLGLAIAERLAAEGCRLVLWARRKGALEEIAARLKAEHGTRALVIEADAQAPGAGAVIADVVLDQLGGADIVVLNAGGPPPVAADATEPDRWRSALELLAVTPIDLATRLLGGMQERGWGRLIAILSSGVRQPISDLAYSNGGRSALAAWLKTVSRPVAKAGVTVNGVLPGRIDTDRARQLEAARAEREGRSIEAVRAARIAEVPAGRYGEAAEVADLVAFLASDRAAYITGSLIPVDGGLAAGQ